MAKKGKKSKGVIPKRIAGVKVPKAVRKGRFGELLASRTGQAVIAKAILGAGAVAAGMKARSSPKVRNLARGAKDRIGDTSREATRDVGEAGSALAYALGEAARTFAEALRDGDHRLRDREPDRSAPGEDKGRGPLRPMNP